MRDLFSGFKWFECITPRDYDMQAGGAITGTAVDRQGYEAVTLLVLLGEYSLSTTISVISAPFVRLQHGDSNAAGTVVYSNCQASHMLFDMRLSGTLSGYVAASYAILHTTSGGSGIDEGVWLHLGVSATMINSLESRTYAVGYLGIKRWVRLMVSCSAVADVSTLEIGAVAILGEPSNWPVQVNQQATS